MSDCDVKEFKLCELLKIYNGTKYDHLNKGDIPLYGSGGLMSHVDEALYSGEAILLPRKGTLSNIMYVNESFWTVDTMYYAVVNDKLADAFYLYSYLSQLDLSNLDSGSTLPSMTKSAYESIVVKLPDLKIQKAVATILFNIRKKLETNNKINQELEAIAKTLYDYWFVQFDFPDQNGKPYKSSGGKMVYHPELKREIPEGWGVEKLDDLGTIVGGSTPTKSISDNFTKGGEGYSWITPNDLSNNKGNKFIKNGEIDVTVKGLKDASLKLYPEGTVLMSSRAPVGYLAIATKELTTNQGFKSFIPDKKYDKNYIYYTLQNCLKVIEQNASGSTFKEISATVLKDIKVLQPNLEIVKKFEITVSSINNYIRDNEVQNQEFTQLRDWLLPMLMNGQVKVE
jgi:type I restriction-modification system specificity determinant protein